MAKDARGSLGRIVVDLGEMEGDEFLLVTIHGSARMLKLLK
jgi:hypothetical protein